MVINIGTGSPPSLLSGGDWDYMDPHGHSVQFYTDDRFLVDEVSRFVGAALGAGDAAVVICTEAHRAGIAENLKARGLDVSLAARQGSYISLDAAETVSTFMADGQPDPSAFSTVVGNILQGAALSARNQHPRVAVFGEMVSVLWANGEIAAAVQLEQLWNTLAATRSFNLRCAYPMQLFEKPEDIEPLLTVCSAHSHVIPTESYSSLDSEEERLRAITLLQQKAQALGTETEARRKVQESLHLREAELADFLENALEGVQQIDAGQIVLWANKAMLNLLGCSSGDYVGHPLGEFFVESSQLDDFWRRLMQREDVYDFDADLRCKDGSVKHVLIHSNGLWEGDRFVHARCFIHDVTSQKYMEQALRERNAALHEAVMARDEFMSVAAHELKTPLTSLRGFAQLILRDIQRNRELSPERLDSAFGAIEVQTGKLNRLVMRLLDSSQIEAGKLRIEPANTDLAALVRSAIAQQRSIPGHTIVYTGPEHLEGEVDPVRFEQVVTNLLDNAVKFSPGGGPVTVELSLGEDGGPRLSVTDNGPGIPPEKREAVFNRFFQANDERHLSGMGLGLYISREIVELHGGTIQVEQPSHSGARFVIQLPSTSGPAHTDHVA